ncbi:2-succinyl-5-enolpyruvyl-6-hydroxy-3-cyclohexene-1-carboxylic-acid synthase [Arcticibacterium luteifluviistationis]|uniref:2-succinyl-5-enolpyruvyl-6-hydroxy-3-cyclohexene-1-carboxylate synthase n=1 Tax=Arcticibacterium luteifluviistationis TaxID=1784714 RepID=A0A2Z4G6V4_9BACT|nr:2-succinyl-5-enolpyruvyl-6-hydroxy-3-cyclohexene-1-carboxylic-acid synthase [Arcticibacterium luteifluviistationis]AWV96878.1 2-succinyl-5-enolpyruvyl-6-hydroxy-3-cyclohexene-1-carboxylic-acid synthase [Arcticibacterium luteifluviistationis]
MTKLEPFQQLARLCLQKGVEHVIICPGSRNAALTIAFTRQKGLKCYSVSDERSAAYMALGMALQTGKTSVIICTSGTAALNFAPAVAEAYFQEIPLLVLTADRPPEWVHQYDGQTIFQENLYGKHVKKAFSWSPDQSELDISNAAALSNQALNISQSQPLGPVHINIPIREPFYPDKISEISQEWESSLPNKPNTTIDVELFKETIKKYPKRLLVIGQQHNETVKKHAACFADKFGFVLVADTIANANGKIKNHDQFLKHADKSVLNPDLLISTDMSLISKSLKLMLRNGAIKEHWHIQDNPSFIDPFRSLTKKVELKPSLFFEQLETCQSIIIDKEYKNAWLALEKKAETDIKSYFENPVFSEFHILKKLLSLIPADSIIHSGNSMSIRYINALQRFIDPSVMIYCNRGTSGIDGSLSTAVGQAMTTDKNVYCILGDLSFQYDKNALWNRYLPDNLKIIILNNAGGIIFNMIDGPKKQDAFNDFFRTEQPNKADLIAQEYGLAYLSIRKQEEVDLNISEFLNKNEKAILEFFTDYEGNVKAFKAFF